MNAIITALITFVSGVLVGSLPLFIHRRFVTKEEKETISKSLMLEIIYMHKSSLHNLLDTYVNVGFNEVHQFWMPALPTTVYDAHVSKVDQLFTPYVALQIHHYYWNIKRLENLRLTPVSDITNKPCYTYLDNANSTFSMLLGTLDVLSEKKDCERVIEENFKSILNYEADFEHDTELLKSFKIKRDADISIIPR